MALGIDLYNWMQIHNCFLEKYIRRDNGWGGVFCHNLMYICYLEIKPEYYTMGHSAYPNTIMLCCGVQKPSAPPLHYSALYAYRQTSGISGTNPKI